MLGGIQTRLLGRIFAAVVVTASLSACEDGEGECKLTPEFRLNGGKCPAGCIPVTGTIRNPPPSCTIASNVVVGCSIGVAEGKLLTCIYSDETQSVVTLPSTRTPDHGGWRRCTEEETKCR